MAVKIILITSCTILSLTPGEGGAIVKGLVPPLALGIFSLLPGLNLKDSSLSEELIFVNSSRHIPSKVVGITPSSLPVPLGLLRSEAQMERARLCRGTGGVILPGLLFIFSYA